MKENKLVQEIFYTIESLKQDNSLLKGLGPVRTRIPRTRLFLFYNQYTGCKQDAFNRNFIPSLKLFGIIGAYEDGYPFFEDDYKKLICRYPSLFKDVKRLVDGKG